MDTNNQSGIQGQGQDQLEGHVRKGILKVTKNRSSIKRKRLVEFLLDTCSVYNC